MTLLISKKLKEYRIKPSKRLGQNFLIDESVLNKIIKASDLKKDDTILEIGPGLGNLTKELAKNVKKVIAIEKDKRFYEILKQELRDYKNIKIINADILKIPDYELRITNYKLIANLPYYITSPVIRKFLEIENKPEQMILMVQKEVAQRIIAQPPRMNLLATSVQFYAKPEIVNYVPKNSFHPKPRVDSAIIKIIPQKIPEVDIKKFFNLVKAGFSSKRKMLKNNLKIDSLVLKNIGLNPKSRAENLSIKNWLDLYEILKSKK